MRDKHLNQVVRISFENFGEFDYIDVEDADAVRHVDIERVP